MKIRFKRKTKLYPSSIPKRAQLQERSSKRTGWQPPNLPVEEALLLLWRPAAYSWSWHRVKVPPALGSGALKKFTFVQVESIHRNFSLMSFWILKYFLSKHGKTENTSFSPHRWCFSPSWYFGDCSLAAHFQNPREGFAGMISPLDTGPRLLLWVALSTLKIHMLVLGGGAFEMWLDHEGGGLMNGILNFL